MKEITKELQLRKIEKNKEIYYSKTLRLGKGAFGEVFLGFDESSHNPFACKIISLEKISTQNNQEVLIKKIKDEIVNMQIARN
jgi:serine/threonine protein kinase